MDYSKYINLTIEEARRKAAEYGQKIRVIKENGNSFLVTAEFCPTRINVEIKNGIIVAVKGLG